MKILINLMVLGFTFIAGYCIGAREFKVLLWIISILSILSLIAYGLIIFTFTGW